MINKNIKNGFMTECNVLLSSFKLNKLFNQNDIKKYFTENNINLCYDFSLLIDFNRFKKTIQYLSLFYESVNFYIKDYKLFLEVEKNLNKVILSFPVIDTKETKEIPKEETEKTKISLTYLKGFVDSFKHKDIKDILNIKLYLTKKGCYPLYIDYLFNKEIEYLIISPRV